jgi:hypothetical protein
VSASSVSGWQLIGKVRRYSDNRPCTWQSRVRLPGSEPAGTSINVTPVSSSSAARRANECGRAVLA